MKAVTKNNSTSYVALPYISYFMGTSKSPALASLVIPESGEMNYKAAGTDADDMFTGNWEISIVPVESTLNDWYADKINVGLWKTAEGVIKKSTTGSKASSTTSGNCYGNGSENPIMGYTIKSSSGTCVETAQKK